MKVKLKNGTEVDLHDDDIKMIHDMYSKGNFDAEKLEHYFKEMHKKAHMNLEMISDYTIETEKDMKDALSKVIKYGNEDEVMTLKNQAATAPLYGMIGGIQNTLNSVIGCAGVRVCPCNNTPISGSVTF